MSSIAYIHPVYKTGEWNLSGFRVRTLYSNPWPLGQEHSALTTRPGLSPHLRFFIEFTFLKFKNEFNEQKGYTLTRKELRTLCFALDFETDKNNVSILSELNEVNDFLMLLEKNWKDAFLTGLLLIYLRNFSESKQNKNSYKVLADFILKKITNYNGNKKPFI